MSVLLSLIRGRIIRRATVGACNLCPQNHIINQIKKYIMRSKSSISIIDPQTSKCPHVDMSRVCVEGQEEFDAFFPEFVDILTKIEPWNKIPEFTEKLRKVLQYNIHSGNKRRAVITVFAYKMLERPENLNPVNMKIAIMLGYCIRMLESSLLMLDDIVDNSLTRWNLPCWYRTQDVGMSAIIDAIYIENGIYFLLKKHLSCHPHYMHLVEHFLDIKFKLSLSQSLDLLPFNLKNFTMDYWNMLIMAKAEYCVAYNPVRAAMYLANIDDDKLHRQIRPILFSMGNYYQMQNDFLDCYGDSQETGKVGTDIEEGRCSWLAVKALEKANSTQKKIMEKHYGKPALKSIEEIRNLYDELELKKEYMKQEAELVNSIKNSILKLPKQVPHDFFLFLVDQFYRRRWRV